MPRETVRALLNAANDPALLATQHSYYLRLARIGADEHYPGVDLLRDWYHRNLMIFANILRLLDQPTSRLLVVIGAGHAPLLQQFLGGLGTCDVAPVSRYLGDAAP